MSKKHKTKSTSLIENYDFIPLMIAMSVVPLLIQITPVEYNTESIYWYSHINTFYDFFSYFKSQAIIFLGILSLIPIGMKIAKNPKDFYTDKVVLISVAAMIIALLSTLFAKSPYIALKGYVERYESIFVVLSYWMFFILAYKIVWSERKLNWMFNGFWITNILLSLLGIGQYFGYDLLMMDWFRPLVTSLKMSGLEFSTEFIVNYKVIGQTLYHYNYVAFFITLSFPIFITKFLYETKWLYKLAYLATSALILFNLLGSTARGGLLGVAASMVFWVLFNWKVLFKNLKLTLIIATLLIVGFISFEAISDGFVTKRILSTFDTPKTEYTLKSLYFDDDTINLQTNEGILSISSKTNDIQDFDLNMTFDNQPIIFYGYNESGHGYFEEIALSDILIYLAVDETNQYYLAMDIKGTVNLFRFDETGFVYRFPNGTFIDLPLTESMGFEGLERMGSGRGFIWSRTIPMIINKPILGYGIDNYAISFPQHDLIGKYNTYNTFNMIVDKAHNLYLQYAVSSGILYLGLYFALVILLIIKSVPFLIKQSHIQNHMYVVALLTAIIGFHVAGYFNDSTVHVGPVFWVMFGLAFGLIKTSELK